MRTTLLQAGRVGAACFGAARQARGSHLAARRPLMCQAEQQRQQGEASPAAAQQQAAAPPAPPAPSVRVPPQQRRLPPPPPSPMDNLKIERVEQLGDSRFSGVVSLDRGETPTDLGKVALLVAGDAAALLLFASIGRLAHGEGLSLAGALGTAWPFMAGFFGAAALLDGYGKAAQGGNTGAAAAAAVKPWALGIPAGLVLRTVSRGYLPEPSFIGVSLAATGVFLVGWRAALAAATPEVKEPQTPREQLAARANRKGNPLELFTMLGSMVKRW